HHERSGGIASAVDLEIAGGALNFGSVLDERIDELGGGGEIGLVCGNNVAARIAMRRVMQHRVVESGVQSTPAASAEGLSVGRGGAARAAAIGSRRRAGGFQGRDAVGG